MYTNILIATDGSELAGKAVQHGIALAKWIGAKATGLTVLPPFHIVTTDTQMIEDLAGGLSGAYAEACRANASHRRPGSASGRCCLRDGSGRA